MSLRRLIPPLVALIAAATVACAEPPDKEMQQAQGAIDAASAVGADQYAREEFAAAEEALKRAREAVDQRDYRQALNAALDAREHAQTAAKDAVNGKAAARVDAEKALGAATAAIVAAHARLKAVENNRSAARAVAAARKAIATEEAAVQEARTAFARGDYPAAAERAKAATARLQASTHDLETPVPTTGRRRR